jgi:hypothetical protein
MSQFLSTKEMYDFLTNDFHSAWNCLAENNDPNVGRGNFTFAWQATVFLEWSSRLCACDPTGRAIHELSQALNQIEPRYFTPFPGKPNSTKGWRLPFIDSTRNELLREVFDLVRNGQSHVYHQTAVELAHGKWFAVSLTGAHPGKVLDKLVDGLRPGDHLAFDIEAEVIWLVLDPAVLFLDIETAIARCEILSRGLELKPFVRRHPMVSMADIEVALRTGGHLQRS